MATPRQQAVSLPASTPLVLAPPTPEQSAAHRSAHPFPHSVIDGLFPTDVLDAVLAEFPDPGEMKAKGYVQFDDPKQKKLAMKAGSGHEVGPNSRLFLQALNSVPVLDYLEKLTGIEGLIPDPYFNGGGLHQIVPGGFLKLHADFNWHKKLKLHRRINLLVYLNKDWKEEYGGHLELWDKDMTACQRKVLPLFGRCVVFNTTDFAYHGHPEPLTCPPDRTRKSIALYYYTATRPKEELSPSHTTLFMKRAGDTGFETTAHPGKGSLLSRITPPLVKDAVRSLRRSRNGKNE